MLPLVWAFNQFGWHAASQVPFWIGPILLYVLLPALDLRFGPDGQNPPDEVMERLENDKYYRYCTYIFIPFQYASVIFGAYLFTASDLSWLGFDGGLSWPAKIGLALSVGVLGGVGINTAHEMGHKKDSLERWLSKITLAQTATATSTSSTTAATTSGSPPRRIPRRPASARRSGSSCRAACGAACGRRGSWRRSGMRRRARARGHLVQRRAQRLADVGGVLGRADRGVRPGADPVHDHPGGLRLHACWRPSTTSSTTGCCGRRPTNGRYERCAPEHSWNSDHMVTNLFLYHLQRHSDHHANPTRRYQTLRSMDGAPNLPSGYASMIALTYFPPLWRRVMDHRVLEHYDGDITKVNVHPRVRDKVLARTRATAARMSAYRCPGCDYVYDEAKGAPREGFPAGTAWSDVPDDWCCPDCAVREKVDFEEISERKK